ncbi:MAG: hypothetical protein FWE28_05805 [Oscillospiraceae bacterium]|nr:hypothetical protein [Oscillospiraceae bacterium]
MRKQGFVLGVMALLILTLSACGGGEGEGNPFSAHHNFLPDFSGNTITVGIVGWGSEGPGFMERVIDFNTMNTEYRIEVLRYEEEDLPRLRTEFMAGAGPDIIYSRFFGENVVDALIDRGLLIDLWPLLDADPDLDRGDFFQNILEAAQTADGRLPVITGRFWIETWIGVPEVFADLESWTVADLITVVNDALDAGVPYPLGEYMSGEHLDEFHVGLWRPSVHRFWCWCEPFGRADIL